jgi:hypothetical protein
MSIEKLRIDEYTIYEGEVENEKPNGKGKIIDTRYSSWAGGDDVYEGNFIDGKLHGKGKSKTIVNGYGKNHFQIREGDFVNGELHGKGKITWTDQDWMKEGDFTNGVLHGKGYEKAVYDEYEGDFVDGKRHGKGKRVISNVISEGDFINNEFVTGKKTYPDGDIFEGNFNYGKLHGKGKKTFSNGDIYEGDFVLDKEHGTGKLTGKDGKIYEGEFADGKPIKPAELPEVLKRNYQEYLELKNNIEIKLKNGDIFIGGVVDSKPHGKGELVNINGDTEEVIFFFGLQVITGSDGIIINRGTIIMSNGAVHTGDFIDRKLQKGMIEYKVNNTKYKEEGDFVDDKLNGKGKITKHISVYEEIMTDIGEWSVETTIYEGDFVNGELHGKGKKTYHSGKVEEGNWDNGKFVE